MVLELKKISTDRDGLYVLDGILGNTTELPILEHATDSHGQLLATFALFDLVGRQLSPRIARITDKPLWRPHAPSHYGKWPLAGPLLAGHVQTEVIEEQWDELARVAGSLKLGYVSASLLVARLQAGSRQHPLAKALLESGKLLRTLHALRWFTDEAFRRRIGRQLNKGESLNDLRRFIAYANAGKEKYRRHEDQTAQAHCLTLVVNICILSTTWYLQDAAAAHQADGHDVSGQVVAHISPGHFEALNLPDLQPCSALGATAQEALAEVLEAKQAWLESARDHGDSVPEPRYRPAIYAAGSTT